MKFSIFPILLIVVLLIVSCKYKADLDSSDNVDITKEFSDDDVINKSENFWDTDEKTIPSPTPTIDITKEFSDDDVVNKSENFRDTDEKSIPSPTPTIDITKEFSDDDVINMSENFWDTN